MSREVRVRFAPSPTGPLHIGGVRTALYNYLFARSNNGKFILRIEDTDQNRFVPGAEEYIIETLDWLNIDIDEGPNQGGPKGPYRQSERKSQYREYADQLIQNGDAYYAFDTPEEIDTMRKAMESRGAVNAQYNSESRGEMRNSISLPKEEVDSLIDSGAPYVIRMKMPESGIIVFSDSVRGDVEVNANLLDDKVLVKSDGMPTYHLANVVDDHLMEISHVIRGEEWLPSAPLHKYMYDCFGWQPPEFAHLPLLLKPDGKGKLSKRDSDKHGFPIFPLEWKDPASGEVSTGFREEDYIPGALINFIALLGWNPGDDREVFSLDELTEAFSLERITKAGARFDIDKAKWFNEQYLRDQPIESLASTIVQEALNDGFDCSIEKASLIAELMKERVSFGKEMYGQARYFFQAPSSYDEKVVRKKWNEDVKAVFVEYADALEKVGSADSAAIKTLLEEILEKHESHLGKVMQILRVSITGVAGGPDLMETISILGLEETSSRIRKAVEVLN